MAKLIRKILGIGPMVVHVYWERKVFSHDAKDMADAREWAKCYPDGCLVSIHRSGERAPLAQYVLGEYLLAA